MQWVTTVRAAAVDLARLVVPVQCAGCGAVDLRLCGECAAGWWEWPMRVESAAPRLDIEARAPLPVWAVEALDGPADSLVRAWKDGSRRDLDPWLAGALRLAARRIGPELVTARSPDGRAAAPGTAAITVVPAPARRSSTRRRGVDLPVVLASGAAAGLRDAGIRAVCVPALRSGGRESRGRSARARWRGAREAVTVTRHVTGPVVLVDDVVTTGATLAACAAALEGAGAMVIAAFAAASTHGGRSHAQLRLGWNSDDLMSTPSKHEEVMLQAQKAPPSP